MNKVDKHRNRLLSKSAVAILTAVCTAGVFWGPLPALAGYSVLYSFAGGTADGASPQNGSLTVSGKSLYGMTFEGGAGNGGVIFKFDTVKQQLTVLHSFAGSPADGSFPFGGLILSGNILYGMTSNGGQHDQGTIFQFNLSSNQITLLHSFNGADPTNGEFAGGDLILSGSFLFGMTPGGGASGDGVIFQFDLANNQFTILHSFAGGASDGAHPGGSLILSKNILYGMTNVGGAANDGVIFQFNLASNEFALLHSFLGEGVGPESTFTISGTTLYGTTTKGGQNGKGLLFSFNSQNGEFTELHSFAGEPADGDTPGAGSLILQGANLLGMTLDGGADNLGAIYGFNPKTGQLVLLHSFAGGGADGSIPGGGLTRYGSQNFGMTSQGGANGHGVIFSLK